MTVTVSESFILTSPRADNEQGSSTFLLPFFSGAAALRASLAEVKASLGFDGVSGSSLTFLPPTLEEEAAAARLFGAMILAESPAAEKWQIDQGAMWWLDKLRHAYSLRLQPAGHLNYKTVM